MLDDRLEELRARDPQAVTAFVRHMEPRLYRFALARVGNPDDAREIVQDAFLDAFRALPDFRGEANIETWIWSILRRRISHHFRRYARKESRLYALNDLGPSREPADGGGGPLRAAEAAELAEQVRDALGEMDPDDQEILLLRDVEGFTNPEVAELLGLSVAAVKSRVHRARLTLRKLLIDRLEPEVLEYD